MLKQVYFTISLLILVFIFLGCTSDPNDEPDNPSEDTIFIAEDNSISLFANGIKLPPEETSFKIEFYTNKGWGAHISYTSESKDWITLLNLKGSPGNNSIVVSISQNNETVNRTATLRITCGSYNEYVNIEQTANSNGVFNVVTPGTLGEFIPEDAQLFIKELTITGKINGTDIKLIRSLFGTPENPQLQKLDLSEATIVSGGEKFVEGMDVDGYTADYTISGYMFTPYYGTEIKIPYNTKVIENLSFFCPNVEELNIPNAIEFIGWAPFSGCNKLTRLEIPASAKPIDANMGLWITNCPNLESLKVLSSSINVSIINCEKISVIELYGSIHNNGINSLPNLVSVILHDGISEIGNMNFQDCPLLKTITIPASVNKIAANAFIYYNSSTQQLDTYLEEIHYEGTSSPWQGYPCGFSGCKLYVPKSVIKNFSNIASAFKDVIGE